MDSQEGLQPVTDSQKQLLKIDDEGTHQFDDPNMVYQQPDSQAQIMFEQVPQSQLQNQRTNSMAGRLHSDLGSQENRIRVSKSAKRISRLQRNFLTNKVSDTEAASNANEAPDPARFLSEDFLQVLDEHRKVCEREGKLDEAYQARKRLKQLRIQEEAKRKEEVDISHFRKMASCDATHKEEIRSLQNKWNNVILPNLENQIALLEMELKKRQQQELDEFRAQIEQGPASIVRVHYSPAVLDLERKIQQMSQIGLYQEAKKLRRNLNVLKEVEKEKVMQSTREKLLVKSQQLIARHQKEIVGIKKKHDAQRELYYRQRQKEFEMIQQRFINVCNDLDGKYKKGLIEMDKNSAVKKMQIKVISKQRQPM